MSVRLTEKASSLIDLQRLKKTRINLAVFGCGNVGGTLLDQVLASAESIANRKDIILNVFAIANSKHAVMKSEGLTSEWRKELGSKGKNWKVHEVIAFARRNNLGNLIAVDNTCSEDFVDNYPDLVKAGFNLVSSNKHSNTKELAHYRGLRSLLEEHGKEYLYETNVGAGLPLIDTIKLLHHSGENITRIRGVFSGSLSYIFNTYSEKEELFSTVVKRAVRLGLTEPDPREDLCGNDVGRKLLILARELELHHEFSYVNIENLIPNHLRSVPPEEFFKRLDELDVGFHIRRKNQKKGHVLRYIGDLNGDLSHVKGGNLNVNLVSVPRDSMIGQLGGSDSLFEIYTENYAQHPIVIKGAGAGGVVTARGVLGDILRLGDKLK